MTTALIVGVDPGPIPGVVVLGVDRDRIRVTPLVLQCEPDTVLRIVGQCLASGFGWQQRVLAVERFVVGSRAAFLATPGAAAITRNMVGAVAAVGEQVAGVQVVLRSAADVMRWASNKRLHAADLFWPTRGKPHARAAARHALYAAVRDCGLPDPLSSRSTAAGGA